MASGECLDKYVCELLVLIGLKRTFPTEPEMLTSTSGYSYSQTLVNLSLRFFYMNRLEHALEAIRDAVDLLRQLAADRPDTFNPALARSLNRLSSRLSDLGHRERALEVIQEAVDLHRQLATERPGVFNSLFASSLDELSQQLTNLGHREQALEALHEAAIIRR
jgi:tetratricopeptide (TPR) repeat protein